MSGQHQTGLVLRRAVAADAAGLATCFEAAYAPARARGVKLPPINEGLDQDILNHLVWVAEDEAIRGGIVVLFGGDVAQLVNIGVDPTHAGQGIGKLLIEKAIKAVRDCGAKRITLVTHVDMPENVGLYHRLGWRETGRSGAKVSMARELD